jgi:hypothetical protein
LRLGIENLPMGHFFRLPKALRMQQAWASLQILVRMVTECHDAPRQNQALGHHRHHPLTSSYTRYKDTHTHSRQTYDTMKRCVFENPRTRQQAGKVSPFAACYVPLHSSSIYVRWANAQGVKGGVAVWGLFFPPRQSACPRLTSMHQRMQRHKLFGYTSSLSFLFDMVETKRCARSDQLGRVCTALLIIETRTIRRD